MAWRRNRDYNASQSRMRFGKPARRINVMILTVGKTSDDA